MTTLPTSSPTSNSPKPSSGKPAGKGKPGGGGRREAPSERSARLAIELRAAWPELTRDERLYVAQRSGLWAVPFVGFPPPELLPITNRCGAVAAALQGIMSRRSNLTVEAFTLLSRQNLEARLTAPILALLDGYLAELNAVLRPSAQPAAKLSAGSSADLDPAIEPATDPAPEAEAE